MSTDKKYIRHGIGSVRPYLYGKRDLPEFVKHAFGAEELERLAVGGGFHVESKIGDSVVVIEAADSFSSNADLTRASIYVYVEDVDAAYKRAMAAGATSLTPPQDKPYQERAAGVKDTSGNTWYIATYRR